MIYIDVFPKTRGGAGGRVPPCGNSDNYTGKEPLLCREEDGVKSLTRDMKDHARLKQKVRVLEKARARGVVTRTILPPNTDPTLIARAYRIAARGQQRDLAGRFLFDEFAALIKEKSHAG